MAYLMVKLLPIIVISLLSSQVDSWWYWWGQGRPKGQYEAGGRDYGYAEGGEHTLLLSASIKKSKYLLLARITGATRLTI